MEDSLLLRALPPTHTPHTPHTHPRIFHPFAPSRPDLGVRTASALGVGLPVSLSQPLQVRKLPNTPRKPFRELTRFAVTQPPGYEAIRGRIGIEPLMAAVDPVLQKISELEDQQRHFAEGTPEFAARQWAIDELKHDIAPFQYQQGLDLLEQMLLYPPAERLSAEQALEHRFFAEYHDPAEEPSVRPDVPFDASFEMFDLGAVCGPHPIVRGSNPVM